MSSVKQQRLGPVDAARSRSRAGHTAPGKHRAGEGVLARSAVGESRRQRAEGHEILEQAGTFITSD